MLSSSSSKSRDRNPLWSVIAGRRGRVGLRDDRRDVQRSWRRASGDEAGKRQPAALSPAQAPPPPTIVQRISAFDWTRHRKPSRRLRSKPASHNRKPLQSRRPKRRSKNPRRTPESAPVTPTEPPRKDTEPNTGFEFPEGERPEPPGAGAAIDRREVRSRRPQSRRQARPDRRAAAAHHLPAPTPTAIVVFRVEEVERAYKRLKERLFAEPTAAEMKRFQTTRQPPRPTKRPTAPGPPRR